jgi:hypothetical protein
VTKKIHHRDTEDTKIERRQKTGVRIQNTEYRIQNTEYRIMRFLSAEGAKFLSPGRRPCDAPGQRTTCGAR